MAQGPTPQPSVRPMAAGTPTIQPTAPVTGETVTVACRVPTGIFMQLFGLEERESERPDGTTKKIKVTVPASERIRINGCAKYRGGTHETAHEVFQGAGLTFGVSADLFNAWMAANRDSEIVKGGLIFAHRRDTRGQAVEHSSQLSGMEPIDPKMKARDPETRGVIEIAF